MLIIVTEGELDEIFIQEYLKSLGHEFEKDFKTESVTGWTKIKPSAPILHRYIDEGNTVVLVFDADGNHNGGGYAKRLAKIKEILTSEGLALDIFLFPNNEDDGDLENLLENIASVERNGVFTCFDNYEDCVKELETDELKYITPARKSRIYAYMESFPETKREKDKEMRKKTNFYTNEKYWDLNSPNLVGLKDFLENRM